MPLTKAQKQKVVEGLSEKIARQKIMIFVSISGLKVKDIFNLRKELKKTDAQLTVIKKTLLKIAFQEKKLEADPKKLEGEIAVVFGFEDELSPAKTVYQFAERNKNIKILGGCLESQKNEFLDAEEIITLAQIPSKEELLTRLIGTIGSPISDFINILQGNIKGLMNVLSLLKT